MRSIVYTSLALVVATPVAAQQTLSVSPIPDNAEQRFCYYAGLAYSQDASMTIGVPNRRESTTALQQRQFVCTKADDGTLVWVGIDIERQGLSGSTIGN